MKAVTFLDANVLAKPFTRTLLWVGAIYSDYEITWSMTVEREANRHMRDNTASLELLRNRYGLAIGPAGTSGNDYLETSPSDRQVLSDAFAARANYLITANVTDFGESDLIACGIVAIHPDLFLADRISDAGYLAALEALSVGMRSPARSVAEVHVAGGRLHPLLAAAKMRLFPDHPPLPPTHPAPAIQVRGMTLDRFSQDFRA